MENSEKPSNPYRSERQRRGMTIVQLSAKYDLSQVTIHRLENGNPSCSKFRSSTRRRLAEAYAVTFDEINRACGHGDLNHTIDA